MHAAVGWGIRTPDIVVGNFNLHKEVLMWVYFTIFNQNYLKTFLTPQEARGNHRPSLKDIVDIIPDTKNNAKEKYAILREN